LPGQNGFYIGDYSFRNCKGLENVSSAPSIFYSNIARLGTGAFEDCSELKKVDLSRTTMSEDILESAFSGCTKLEKVLLPNGLFSIERNSFLNCTSLTDLY
jgi:hypothetical protein